MTRQRLGQHFLADAGWREKIARAIRLPPYGAPSVAQAAPYSWIEVGAGHGEMTEFFAKSGTPVYAIELDTRLIPRLAELSKRYSNLRIVPGDVLQTDLASLTAGRRIRVYGNLPYYITSPILHHLFKFAADIEEIHIVIQQEVAFRLVARPGIRDYGYLSVLTQFYSNPEISLKIPRSAFRPPPDVGSALVSMRLPGEDSRLGVADNSRFFDFVKLSFAQKRKTLVNNLRSIAKPEEVRALLCLLKLKEGVRAEQLSVDELAGLYSALSPIKVPRP
jgi:16S rRNA (adenine1518-N6/adenine1519-N6)-dimethyltransferase